MPVDGEEMKLGYMNVDGLNVGKIEDIMNECYDWSLDVVCLTETHLRENLEIDENVHKYRVIGKGRSKQRKKGGGLAVMVRKECNIVCEILDVGESDMSEDIMIVKLDSVRQGRKECLYLCVCYMTIESTGGIRENRSKYEILKNFVSLHEDEKIVVVGDMNGHMGLLGESENGNGKLLREKCEEMKLEILNETLAEGKITWQRRELQSAIDYVLVNGNARAKVKSVWIDEWGEFGMNSDHNLIIMRYEWVHEMRNMRSTSGMKTKWKLRTGDWSKYRDELREVNLSDTSDINELCNELVNKVRSVAERTVGRVCR